MSLHLFRHLAELLTDLGIKYRAGKEEFRVHRTISVTGHREAGRNAGRAHLQGKVLTAALGCQGWSSLL